MRPIKLSGSSSMTGGDGGCELYLLDLLLPMPGNLVVSGPRKDRVRGNSGEWLWGYGRSCSQRRWYSSGRSLKSGEVSGFWAVVCWCSRL